MGAKLVWLGSTEKPPTDTAGFGTAFFVKRKVAAKELPLLEWEGEW